MSIKSIATTLVACGLLACTLSAAWAQTTPVVVTAPPPVSAPAPAKLGQGESQISVALAKAELSKLGITQPTRAQLNAAQYGGTVTTASGTRVQLVGVQTQRDSGMGWGQIAHAMGLKLGAVVSASKRAGEQHDKNHEAHGVKEGAGADGSAHAQGEGGSHAGGGNSGGNGGGGNKK
jgi:hypothetical protein